MKILDKLKAELKSERDKDPHFYTSEDAVGLFAEGFDRATDKLMPILEQAIEALEYYSSCEEHDGGCSIIAAHALDKIKE